MGNAAIVYQKWTRAAISNSGQTRPDSASGFRRVCEFGSSGWSGSPRPDVPGHGGRARVQWGRDMAVLCVVTLCPGPERDEGGIPVGVKSPRQGCGRAAAEALTAWVSKS